MKHRKVTFVNRYGITLAADLYEPLYADGKFAAIAVSGPFGAVKEQCRGHYAQALAARGFLTLAFDPSFTGESGGMPRRMASPDINTEDFQAAVDFLSTQPDVDPERIGILGICDEELEKLGTEDYERSIPWKSDDSYHLSYPGAPRDDEVLGREYWSHLYASDALAFTRLKKMALDVLESVTIPTYVYHGLKDETAPPDGLVETFSKVKGRVRIKIFDEGTHLLMYDRCRDVEKELIASIASVLDGRPAL